MSNAIAYPTEAALRWQRSSGQFVLEHPCCERATCARCAGRGFGFFRETAPDLAFAAAVSVLRGGRLDAWEAGLLAASMVRAARESRYWPLTFSWHDGDDGKENR